MPEHPLDYTEFPFSSSFVRLPLYYSVFKVRNLGYSDTNALKVYFFDLPEGSKLTGDKAYTDYVIEDVINEAGISFSPLRKKNSSRPVPPWVHYLMSSYRKMVETTGSMIERLLPKHIHAVTARGFEIKVALFVLACSINYLVR